MASWWKTVYNQLFSQAPEPRLHEVLLRSEGFLLAYRNWLSGTTSRQLLCEVHKAYYYPEAGIAHPYTLHKLQSPQANGFALSADQAFDHVQGRYLLELWRNRLRQANYRTATADRRLYPHALGYVEEIERYYLKPPLQAKVPLEQAWGNICLELILHDGAAAWLRIQASVYADAHYKPAESFASLAELLLKDLTEKE